MKLFIRLNVVLIPMRQYIKFSFLSLAYSICFVLLSCSENSFSNQEKEDEYKSITFDIKFDCQFSEVPLEPILRSANNNKIYAVQIFEYNTNTQQIEPYAYGIFDDISKMNINMKKDRLYKINVGLFYNFFERYKFIGYREALDYTIPNNKFIYSDTWIFLHLYPNISTGYDMFCLKDSKEANRSMIECDSAHGIIDEFNPKENSTIEIELIRSSFGISINVKGMTEGKIKWIGSAVTAGVGGNQNFDVCTISYPNTSYENIFSIAQFMRNIITDSNYLRFELYYYDSFGNVTKLNDKSITIYRNKRTIVNITLKSDSKTEVIPVFLISEPNAKMEDTTPLSFDFTID